MRTLALASLALFLTGCNVAYRLPEGAAQTAKVRFSAPEAERRATTVGVYVLTAEDSCMDARKLRQLGGLQLGGISGSEVDIGMLKEAGTTYKKNMYVEISVEAEKRLNFAFAGGHGGSLCHLSMSFLPKAGSQYEVGYHTENARCYGNVIELVQVGDKVTASRELSAKLNAKTCRTFWN